MTSQESAELEFVEEGFKKLRHSGNHDYLASSARVMSKSHMYYTLADEITGEYCLCPWISGTCNNPGGERH